jgi:hypothetical protein
MYVVSMNDLVREAIRETVSAGLFLFPDQQVRIDRWLRGREEFRKLQLSDYVVMSWGKSGRTWLRVMVSRYYQLLHGLEERDMLEFDNLHGKIDAIPKIFFTHGNYLRDFTGTWNDKSPFYGKKVVLLIRDPRDVAVSQYFQWKYRMRPIKKRLNHYPPHGADISLFDFVMDRECGLPVILDFFEMWENELERCAASVVIRYEEMRGETEVALSRVIEFFDGRADAAKITEAVEYARFENMRKLEQNKTLGSWGHRLRPGDKSNPQSFKTRRAKVGGHREDFNQDELAAIDALVAERPVFGYGKKTPENEEYMAQ